MRLLLKSEAPSAIEGVGSASLCKRPEFDSSAASVLKGETGQTVCQEHEASQAQGQSWAPGAKDKQKPENTEQTPG